MNPDDIITLNLQVPPSWRMALEVATLAQEQDGIVAGEALRSLYMQQVVGREAAMQTLSMFLEAGPRGEPSLRLYDYFGQPSHLRRETFLRSPVSHGRLSYVTESRYLGGAERLQINISKDSHRATPEGYLATAPLGINQIVYDGLYVMATNLFLQDASNGTITYNPWLGWTLENLDAATREVQDLLSRPEFTGFQSNPPPEGDFNRAEGPFWDSLADHYNREGS